MPRKPNTSRESSRCSTKSSASVKDGSDEGERTPTLVYQVLVSLGSIIAAAVLTVILGAAMNALGS
jgi:hypothetical protein